MKKLSLISLLASFICYSIFAENIQMKDLRALDQNKEYSEIINKARSVPPSERESDWIKIYGKAIASRINKMKEDGYSQSAFEIGRDLEFGSPNLESVLEFNQAMYKAALMAYDSKEVAVKYISRALIEKDPECKNKDIQASVSLAVSKRSDEESVKSAMKVATFLCIDELDNDWMAQMLSTDLGLKNACGLLIKTGKLKGARLTKCKNR